MSEPGRPKTRRQFPLSTRRVAVTAASAAVLLLAACAPEKDDAKASSSPSSSAKGTAGAAACAPASLRTCAAGTLTVGTDKPAYAPWFQDDDPTSGKGFESAVAYAVAAKLGYAKGKVSWTTVPFNSAVAPGPKKYDFDVNQVSITDERRKAVDFSTGYYDVKQAVIALKTSKIAHAASLSALRDAKLGAQVGTTSLTVLRDQVRPTQQPAVFQRNDLAKSALSNGQVDGIVVDLPTAVYMTSVEIKNSVIVGQFAGSGAPEQFGLVLDRNSPLTHCVSTAVDALRADGTLARLEKQYLSDAIHAPVLTK